MSNRLAISSAFSVFMMACYVLLGGNPMHDSLGAPTATVPQVSAPAILPQVSALLPR